jgi:hypothetical protein
MTQLATPAGVVGDFDGVKLELLGKTYQLERRGDEFWVEMEDPEWRSGRRSAAPHGECDAVWGSSPDRIICKRTGSLASTATCSHSFRLPGS